MKATLSYNLPEEQELFERAVASEKYSILLHELEQNIFRPARKHGYAVGQHAKRLNELLMSETSGDDVTEAIHLLEEMYYRYKNDINVPE